MLSLLSFKFFILCLALWTMTSFLLFLPLILESFCCFRVHLYPGEYEIASDNFIDALNVVKPYSQNDTNVHIPKGQPCSDMPNMHRIKMNNIYWQHFQLNSGKINIYLYAAYYDSRKAVNVTGASVRLLAMSDFAIHIRPKTFCQFWFRNKKRPTLYVRASFEHIWHEAWGHQDDSLVPVLISCPIPVNTDVPFTVSLVEHKWGIATCLLRVQHSFSKDLKRIQADPRSIAVCVKGLTFPDEDLSARLVEWLELLKLLGVQQVSLYELALHAKSRRTLRHYQKSGFVELIPLTLPGKRDNTPELLIKYFKQNPLQRRMHEVIAYNDCLYRNLYRHEYLAVLDIDEVILPKKANIFTWKEMLKDSNMSQVSSICARNAYFFDEFKPHNSPEIPPYLHMLNHIKRASRHSHPGWFLKCFHRVNQVRSLHNHLPVHCFSECKCNTLDTSVGQLHHYREGCGFNSICQSEYVNRTVIDTTILKYKNELITNSNRVLMEVGYLD